MTADANTLIQFCRLTAQRYLYQYQEQIPCEQLAQKMCDLKQGYTQHGGLRPYGVSFLYAGYDEHYQFQLYHSDPSGNYAGWKAHCIGANDSQAQSILKQEYKDDMSLKDGVKLAVKVLSKSMETTSLTGEKLEFAIVSAVDTDAGKRVCVKMFSTDEIDQLLKEYKEEKTE
jgi:20S proteasome subunit alpha 3